MDTPNGVYGANGVHARMDSSSVANVQKNGEGPSAKPKGSGRKSRSKEDEPCLDCGCQDEACRNMRKMIEDTGIR